MNPKSIFPQTDDRLFEYFLKQVGAGIIATNDQDPNKKRLPLYMLGFFLIAGTEPFKILLRRNIGKFSISLGRTVIASIFYFICALFILLFTFGEDFSDLKTGLYAGATFYILLSLIIVAIAFREKSKANQYYSDNKQDFDRNLHRGESLFFKGYDIEKIWSKTEPSFCFFLSLLITILLTYVHFLYVIIGLPLILTSISFWFNEWFQVNNVWGAKDNKILKAQAKAEETSQSQPHQNNDEFGAASTD